MKPVKDALDAAQAVSLAVKGGLIAQHAVKAFRLGKGDAKIVQRGENKGLIRVTVEVFIEPVAEEEDDD